MIIWKKKMQKKFQEIKILKINLSNFKKNVKINKNRIMNKLLIKKTYKKVLKNNKFLFR